MSKFGGWVAAVSVLCAATLVAKELEKKPVPGSTGNAAGGVGPTAGAGGVTAGGGMVAGQSKSVSCPSCKGDLAKDGDIWECAACKLYCDADGKKIECEGCQKAAQGKAPCDGCENGKCEKTEPAHRDCKGCKVRWGAGRSYACTSCADAAQASVEGKPGMCDHCKVKFLKGTPVKGGPKGPPDSGPKKIRGGGEKDKTTE